jgi:hypothetical protein
MLVDLMALRITAITPYPWKLKKLDFQDNLVQSGWLYENNCGNKKIFYNSLAIQSTDSP